MSEGDGGQPQISEGKGGSRMAIPLEDVRAQDLRRRTESEQSVVVVGREVTRLANHMRVVMEVRPSSPSTSQPSTPDRNTPVVQAKREGVEKAKAHDRLGQIIKLLGTESSFSGAITEGRPRELIIKRTPEGFEIQCCDGVKDGVLYRVRSMTVNLKGYIVGTPEVYMSTSGIETREPCNDSKAQSEAQKALHEWLAIPTHMWEREDTEGFFSRLKSQIQRFLWLRDNN